jgi:zinc finger CCCH domain-containing protein 13
VAPLKEAGKEGVPPEARWTKISRMLVNPEALEQARERFEEREDYVIVLRVISKDEIAKLAEKTREIRGK